MSQFKIEILFFPDSNLDNFGNIYLLVRTKITNPITGVKRNTKVQAEIVDQVKGDTVIAYKQKRRKGFHKKKGHRTAYTKIKVTSIA